MRTRGVEATPAAGAEPPRGWQVLLAAAVIVAAVCGSSAQQPFSYQVKFDAGQNIAPVFEGWEQNPDGSFNMVFGYFNRNYKEHPHVPVGPDNRIEPGGPDQGQPTYFLPRRSQFVFRVRVPADFGDNELVWTLIVNGKTERAYASLLEEYAVDDGILIRNYANSTPPRYHENRRPVITVEGAARRTVKVGEPLDLTALVADDDLLEPRPSNPGFPRFQLGGPGYNPALGLRVAWFVYRGQGDQVVFDPEQFDVWDNDDGNSPWTPGWEPPPVPPDGKYPVRATFREPGAYVVRVLAHDGVGVSQDVTVDVTPR